VFQDMIFPYIRIAGLSPLILPLVVAGVAVSQGRLAGGIVGIFAGIMCDLSLNEPVGLFVVLLTFSGLLIGTLADSIVSRSFAAYFLFCVGVLVLVAIAQIIPIYLSGVFPNELIMTAVWQTVYSLVFSVPVWFFVKGIERRIDRAMPTGKA